MFASICELIFGICQTTLSGKFLFFILVKNISLKSTCKSKYDRRGKLLKGYDNIFTSSGNIKPYIFFPRLLQPERG